MTEPLAVLGAARDEEARIGRAVRRLRDAFPGAAIFVADDGSHDATAEVAEAAGAGVVRLSRLGKGQALTLAERELPPGPLLLCDADLDGDLRPLIESDADLAIAVFARREGGGFGIAKRAAKALIAARSGFVAREPLSGQRRLSERARRCARKPRSGPLQKSSASPTAATGATAGTLRPTAAPTSGSRNPR